jgi:hypothetical protein
MRQEWSPVRPLLGSLGLAMPLAYYTALQHIPFLIKFTIALIRHRAYALYRADSDTSINYSLYNNRYILQLDD